MVSAGPSRPRVISLLICMSGGSARVHLGAIVSVVTDQARDPAYYRQRLTPFRSLSHVTVEVQGPR